MIKDLRPYWVKKSFHRWQQFYTEHFLRPNFTHMGIGQDFLKPWNINVHGPNISLGDRAHFITTPTSPITLCVWRYGDDVGEISIGNYVLICPAVRINSASRIEIGDNVMIANGVYISDADWHDIYDRTRPIGNTKPVVLKDNVWLCDSVIVNKGVTIGENSIIGSGSVVTKDIPADVIAAGNPARVIRSLDESKTLVKREDMFKNHEKLAQDLDALDRMLLKQNNLWSWFKGVWFPKQGD